MSSPLAGQTIALAEGRQLEDLAEMLEKEGALPLRCPLISILDAPDTAPVLAWIEEVIAGKIDLLVLMTGEALRRLLPVAEHSGQREAFIQALGRTTIITRGPKPVRALKEIAITPALIAEAPTTPGVIATLRGQALTGKTVGLTLYGAPNPTLEGFLTESGATVRTVLPYVLAPATDMDRIIEVLQRMANGEVQFLLFTSSSQVERLFEVAEQRGVHALLQQAFARTKVAAVGPIVADTLRERQVRVDVCPEQGFVMKNLVQYVKRSH